MKSSMIKKMVRNTVIWHIISIIKLLTMSREYEALLRPMDLWHKRGNSGLPMEESMMWKGSTGWVLKTLNLGIEPLFELENNDWDCGLRSAQDLIFKPL